MPDTLLRPGRSDLPCTDTGTMATSDESGSTSLSVRYCRSAPATRAITTSLSLTPKWFLTALTSSRSNWANATLRRPVMLALNGVCGAVNGLAMASPDTARRTVSTTVVTVPGSTRVARCTGRVANRSSPRPAISSWLALPEPFTGAGGGGSASVLHSCDIRLAPVTPSTAAWCTLVITAIRPPAWASVPSTPSMTHISHSGRLRSSGSEARCPQISASSMRPPGGGQAHPVQMAVDVKVLVLHPHWMVEVERAVGQLVAELRHRVDAHRQLVAQLLEAVAAGDRRGVQLQDRAHVKRLGGRFEVEEAGVESAEPLHVRDGMSGTSRV